MPDSGCSTGGLVSVAVQAMTIINAALLFSKALAAAHAGPYRPQQPGLSKAQEARLIAEENTRRLLRLSSQAIKYALSPLNKILPMA